jgi:hypothetical protein
MEASGASISASSYAHVDIQRSPHGVSGPLSKASPVRRNGRVTRGVDMAIWPKGGGDFQWNPQLGPG